VQGCASLRVVAQQNGYPACLYLQRGRPWGPVPAEQRLCRAVQAWRAQPSGTKIVHVCISSMTGLGGVVGRAEIVQGCAGLGVWPGRDCECLWIPGLQGSSKGDPAGLRGGSLG
jgi:hypothetical protein